MSSDYKYARDFLMKNGEDNKSLTRVQKKVSDYNIGVVNQEYNKNEE
jgi:hypothetical protein